MSKNNDLDENVDPCINLPWDSQFFDRRIARVKSGNLDLEGVREVSEWCKANNIDCAYFLLEYPNKSSVELLLENGFFDAGMKNTFGIEATENKIVKTDDKDIKIGTFKEEDVEGLKKIASSSYHETRFYNDPKFDDKKCDEFYETWIENSCRGYADNVFVSRQDSKTMGYVTCHKKEDRGVIGLIGVAKEDRGHGVGKALISAAIKYFSVDGLTNIRAVTQGNNNQAIRFYENCGFKLLSVEQWFHRWFE